MKMVHGPFKDGVWHPWTCSVPLESMMEAVRTSETSVDNHSTRQYNPEDSSEHQRYMDPLKTSSGIPGLVRCP
jgi:hypothetical protein